MEMNTITSSTQQQETTAFKEAFELFMDKYSLFTISRLYEGENNGNTAKIRADVRSSFFSAWLCTQCGSKWMMERTNSLLVSFSGSVAVDIQTTVFAGFGAGDPSSMSIDTTLALLKDVQDLVVWCDIAAKVRRMRLPSDKVRKACITIAPTSVAKRAYAIVSHPTAFTVWWEHYALRKISPEVFKDFIDWANFTSTADLVTGEVTAVQLTDTVMHYAIDSISKFESGYHLTKWEEPWVTRTWQKPCEATADAKQNNLVENKTTRSWYCPQPSPQARKLLEQFTRSSFTRFGK
ncbi:hypothetical protein J8273_6119 [Carpediemonas membranifera]|uniref:Uncharacterized protein n=1 Tax=Carpediemonas membranifera TaxID=201153 RepID=A0A8J6AY98_9EUKA|nr:hypothetical protein J8273_6119 [Carpediemonas membranifera]|eukprot:KAG9391368.1 hypothetical protein J8273_6119 [Carpediemonas membranifera]